MKSLVIYAWVLMLAMLLAPQDSLTSEWQTIDFKGLFGFRLPTGFVTGSSDDTRAEYCKDGMKLIVVWGRTESRPFEKRKEPGMNDYHESLTRIGGRRANIRSYWRTVENSKRLYYAELNIGNWEKGEVEIYMRLESEGVAGLRVADQIFKSITLPLPPPEGP